MNGDELPERLAEALWNASGEPAEMVPFHKLSAVHQDEYRRMVPVVREYARQRAAEELLAMTKYHDVYGVDMRDRLRARAAVLAAAVTEQQP